MKPVVTAEEMAEVDAKAQATIGLQTLVERAGFCVARLAVAAMGGTYGRRIVVVAGKGHNGDDGRTAAALLSERGARVTVVPVAETREVLPSCDLVIDAAFGTGFRGEYKAPKPPDGAIVLAVDIPSGVSANTGMASEEAVRADLTVTFGALKPGLLLGDGADHCGAVVTEPIGLDVGTPHQQLLEDADIAWLPARERESNKWKTAVAVVAGSPGMFGSAAFAAAAAVRSGAGMVRLGSPGVRPGTIPVLEAVAIDLDEKHWVERALEELERCKALVVGPGLGRSDAMTSEVRELVARALVPVVIDADGLYALGSKESAAELLARRSAPTVLTPHDGEFARLAGGAPSDDRLKSVRGIAAELGAIVLLKGATTVVAEPGGEVLLAAAGSARLATAGTGDVLSGVIGAFVARGLDPLRATALAAHVHGRAAAIGFEEGLEASDLPILIASVLSEDAKERSTNE